MSAPTRTSTSPRPPPFHVNSGRVIWGPLTTALEGAIAFQTQGDGTTVDTSVTSPDKLEGGTILQSNWHYISQAKKGEWQVSRLFQGRAQYPKNQYGSHKPPESWAWCERPYTIIFHHSTANPVDIAKRCHKVGISLQQQHEDKRIRYVNRYDWGYHHRVPHAVRNVLGLGHPRTPASVNELLLQTRRSEFVFADAAGSLDSIKNVLQHAEQVSKDKDNYHMLPLNKPYAPAASAASSSSVSSSSTAAGPSGCLVTLESREYELGWLVFDEEHPDTLIGFVYDMYSAWSHGELCPIKVEDEVILSLEAVDGAIQAQKDAEAKKREETAQANRQVIAGLIAARGDKSLQQLASDLYDLVKTTPSFKDDLWMVDHRCEELLDQEKADANGAEPVIYKDIFDIYDEFEKVRREKEPPMFDAKAQEERQKQAQATMKVFDDVLLSLVPSASSGSSSADSTGEDNDALLRSVIDRLHAAGVTGELQYRVNDDRFPKGWVAKLNECSEKMRQEELAKRDARAAELKQSYLKKHPEHPAAAAAAAGESKTIGATEAAEGVAKPEDDWRARDEQWRVQEEKLKQRDELVLNEIFEVNAGKIIEASATGVNASAPIIELLANELNNAGVKDKHFEEMLHYWAASSSKQCGRDTTPVFDAIYEKLAQLTKRDAGIWGRQFSMYH